MNRQTQTEAGGPAPRGAGAKVRAEHGKTELAPNSENGTRASRITHRPGCLFYLAVTNFVLLTAASILYNVGLKVAAYAIGWPLVVLLPALGIGVWVGVGWAGIRAAREVEQPRTEEREGTGERTAGLPGAPEDQVKSGEG